MKFGENQKRLYLMALGLFVLAIALVCAWPMLNGGNGGEGGEGGAESTVVPTLEPLITSFATHTPEPTGTPGASGGESPAPTGDGIPATAGVDDTVDVVVYYRDNYGYLVPVMCTIPYEEGIAKAALSMMTGGGENDLAAARLGLRTVLPEGVSFDLDIAGGAARIDLSGEALSCADAAAEAAMVDAIVLTLTEFDTVETVEFLVGGQKISTLSHGTDLSKPFSRSGVNPEDGEGRATGQVTLYFPGEDATVLVPVTRAVRSTPDIETAVLELLRGPENPAALSAVAPEGTELIRVEVENGVARIHLEGGMAEILDGEDGGLLALRAIAATCAEFPGIEQVELYVDGEKLDLDQEALAVPAFINAADDILYDYIEAQSDAIFGGD